MGRDPEYSKIKNLQVFAKICRFLRKFAIFAKICTFLRKAIDFGENLPIFAKIYGFLRKFADFSQITAPATTQRNLLDDVEVWASPITAPPPTLAVLPEEPLGDDCALCQQRLVEGSGRNSNRPLWRWPCRCGMQIHLSCMMHMRIRCPAPQCMHCRDPWPGDSADELLQSECHRAGFSIENTWEDFPEQQESNMLEGMPPRPNNVLVLCCARTSAWDVTVHAREMEWSPNRVFQVNAQGIREQTGWEGEWGCNLCGRTILHNDPLIMGGAAASHAEAICSADGPRTLVVDLVHGSRNWICLPGCTLPFRADGAVQHVARQSHRVMVATTLRQLPPLPTTTAQIRSSIVLCCCMQLACWSRMQSKDGVMKFHGLNRFVQVYPELSTTSTISCKLMLNCSKLLLMRARQQTSPQSISFAHLQHGILLVPGLGYGACCPRCLIMMDTSPICCKTCSCKCMQAFKRHRN